MSLLEFELMSLALCSFMARQYDLRAVARRVVGGGGCIFIYS